MKKRPKPPSARTERRATARMSEKLATDRIRLARLEPGGSPSAPIPVASASVVEPRALSFACLRCEGDVRVTEHDAEVRDGRPLRAVQTRCKHCDLPRTIWFAVAPPLAN